MVFFVCLFVVVVGLFLFSSEFFVVVVSSFAAFLGNQVSSEMALRILAVPDTL